MKAFSIARQRPGVRALLRRFRPIPYRVGVPDLSGYPPLPHQTVESRIAANGFGVCFGRQSPRQVLPTGWRKIR